MEFKTLENIPLKVLARTFNEAFENYFVPVKYNEELIKYKISIEKLNLELSIGAFENDRLVGFIWHCSDFKEDKKTAYNAATGVMPNFRGNGLTSKMYEHIIPQLKSSEIQQIELEVIDENIPAIKSYKKVGFEIVRNLHCFKGKLASKDSDTNIQIRELMPNLGFAKKTATSKLTWQNFAPIKNASISNIKAIGAFENENLLGQLIFNENKSRIHHISVHDEYRGKKIGSQMMKHFEDNYSTEIAIINVDRKNIALNKLFLSSGLENFLTQKEMILEL